MSQSELVFGPVKAWFPKMCPLNFLLVLFSMHQKTCTLTIWLKAELAILMCVIGMWEGISEIFQSTK